MAVKICIDAGHYGKTNRSSVVKEYYESEMNWKLHLLLKKYLEQYGFEVIQTRTNQAADLSLSERGKASKGCDLFLSIHSNACDTESVDRPVVIVQLDGKGDTLGKALGQCIQNTMNTKGAYQLYKRKGSNGGEYYGVLRSSAEVGTVGMILEHSFHTNTAAAKWLLIDSNLDKLAKAEADTIAAHFGVKVNTTSVVYRVQVGAYSVKANAEAMLAKLKKAGFDGFITTEGTEPAKKSIDELAEEVIAGKWGVGTDRKNRLTAAGYDYTAVQNRVNELMKG